MGRVERGDSGIDIETDVEHEYAGLLDAAKIDAVGDDSRAARSLQRQPFVDLRAATARVTATLFSASFRTWAPARMEALRLLWLGGTTRAVREPGLTAVGSAEAFTERFPRFTSKLARGAKVHEESGAGAVFLAWCFVASKSAAGSSAMGRS